MAFDSVRPGALAVTLTVEQLERRIDHAIAKALAARATPALINTATMAERLDMHPKTLARLVRTEGLPAHRLGSAEYRFDPVEVEAWVRARGAAKGRAK